MIGDGLSEVAAISMTATTTDQRTSRSWTYDVATPSRESTPWGRKNMIRIDTPAMPFNDGRFGGSFESSPRQYAIHTSGSAKPGGNFFGASVVGSISYQDATWVREWCEFSFACVNVLFSIRRNTPAMPLNDAQIGGFFYARRSRV